MRKSTALAITLTVTLILAQPALAAKAQQSRVRTPAPVAAPQTADDVLISIKKAVKKFFGTRSFEQISTPVPKP